MDLIKVGAGSEGADDYPAIVARLNDRWRVIAGTCGIQWILQRRGSPEKARRDDWRGRSYFRTREALIRCSHALSGQIDPAASAILANLPERFPEKRAHRLIPNAVANTFDRKAA
jgi:hypothetical protein